MEPSAERSYSKLEWVIYIIILPLIFISILTITLLWFLDYDVKNKLLVTLNNVPLIEKFIDDDKLYNENSPIGNNKEDLKFAIEELKKTVDEKDLTLTQSEKTLTEKDEEIKKLNQQIEELQKQLQEKNISEQSREQEIAELAKVYANMSAKNAAKIISELSYEEAALILEQMNTDAKSKILEKMDQKKAADISVLLKDSKYSKDVDIKALQERINILTKEIEEIKANKLDYQQIALTYSSMDSVKAAEAILVLSSQDAIMAKNILIAMDPVSRSNILSQMNSSDAASLTADIVN